MRNTDGIQPLKIEPMTTGLIKFTIDEVYSSINNGAAIDVWGIPCMEEEGKTFDDPNRKISLKCEDNLTNNDDIEKKNF